MEEEIVIPLGIFGGFFLLLAFNTFAKSCERIACHWREVSLKIRMVDEGFRPHEIEQVVTAGRRGPERPKQSHKPPVREPVLAKHA